MELTRGILHGLVHFAGVASAGVVDQFSVVEGDVHSEWVVLQRTQQQGAHFLISGRRLFVKVDKALNGQNLSSG